MKLVKTILISVLMGTLLVSVAATAKEKEPQTPGRLLTGRVVDRQENALPNAIVYVTDTRSRAVKTYIVGPDGGYRFPALSTTVDYEVYAQFNGKTSDTKRISQFDDRKVLSVVLKIDTK
ncbi:MAG TPA: carboxypeptidase-like regulatory domain-containing protein [Terriglobales bacterium]|nr:carboxypeptidase-like regulatory domain-containing protein [Terriglobales bacterium]